MHPPSRTRRILKWTGLIGSLLTLAALWGGFNYQHERGRIWASRGKLILEVYRGDPGDLADFAMDSEAGWDFWFAEGQFRAALELNHPIEVENYVIRERGYMGHERATYGKDDVGGLFYEYKDDLFIWELRIRFWVILCVFGIPTAFLMYRDRRRIRPGHCSRCGYDLTGNTSGKCSECGEKTATTPRPSARPQ